MNNRSVLLIIAIVILIILINVLNSNWELFKDEPYVPQDKHLLSAAPFPNHSASDYTAKSSVDCSIFPDAPGCQPLPPVAPTATTLPTCTPTDGVWSTSGMDEHGRSGLASPCCQPPDYKLAQGYKTCDDPLDTSDPIQKCIKDCCDNADNEAASYDASWYPMARCACSLWCNNQDVPHFKKYGTAVHYIEGDIAEAETGDEPDFIGAGDFGGD